MSDQFSSCDRDELFSFVVRYSPESAIIVTDDQSSSTNINFNTGGASSPEFNRMGGC